MFLAASATKEFRQLQDTPFAQSLPDSIHKFRSNSSKVVKRGFDSNIIDSSTGLPDHRHAHREFLKQTLKKTPKINHRSQNIKKPNVMFPFVVFCGFFC